MIAELRRLITDGAAERKRSLKDSIFAVPRHLPRSSKDREGHQQPKGRARVVSVVLPGILYFNQADWKKTEVCAAHGRMMTILASWEPSASRGRPA
jgi:hypothetical protein